MIPISLVKVKFGAGLVDHAFDILKDPLGGLVDATSSPGRKDIEKGV